MSGLFVCPLCGGALERQGGSYLCPAGHCYDISREGYTYLLPVNRRHSKAPGDDMAMTAARHAFLEKGYYAPLREKLCQLAVELTGDTPAVLDNGCGEGYTPPVSIRRCARRAKRPAWPVSTSPSPSSGWLPGGKRALTSPWRPPTVCRWRTAASTCW